MRTVIAVSLHNRSEVPTAPLYLPVQAGAALNGALGIARDDTGENISGRNPLYCELTVHYWLWRNLPPEAEALGLCHYRRYFTRRPRQGMAGILTQAETDALLNEADVIVPQPRLYLIETNYTQYIHAHRVCDLDLARAVIAERHGDFLPAFDRVMKRRWGRRFNMCIMRRAAFEAYSAWLFDILFEMERRLAGDAPPRTLGYIAERLMDVWLEVTRPRIRQLPVLHTEGENWPAKIAAFLKRKFTYVKTENK